MARPGRWLLERVLARERAEDIVGDLEERHALLLQRHGRVRARLWYYREAVLLCLRPSLLRLPHRGSWRRLLHGLAADARFALRLMVREPVSSAAMVLTLAVGIGAVTMVFAAADRFLMRPPDGVREPDRLIEVYRRPWNEQHARAAGYDGYRVLTQSNVRLLSEATTLDGAALLSPRWTLSIAVGSTDPERVEASFVSGNWFELLGAPPALGRSFAGTDESPGASPYLVLSHAYWQRRFASDPSIVGRTLRVEDRELTVIGVAARGFVGTSVARAPDVWIPVSMIEAIPLWGARAGTTGMFIGVARLRAGVTMTAVEAELARLSETHLRDTQSTFRAALLRQVTVDPNRRRAFSSTAAILFGSAALLLLIGCLNVSSILLARSIRRHRELAVRVALGASRIRLVRQLFTEAAVPYLVGGAAGMGLLLAARTWIDDVRPPGRFFFSNPALELPLDVRVLAFTLLATGLCTIVFGLLPAWRALRGDPRIDLHPYASAVPARVRTRDALVTLQIAFCLVALAGAGLFLRGLQAARSVDTGFDPRNLGMVSVNLHYAGYDRDRQHDYYRRAIEATEAVPGVTVAGLNWLRPLEFGPVYGLYARPDAPPEDRYVSRATAVTPGFLAAAGIPLLAGRDFTPSDRRDSDVPADETAYVVILNERAVQLLWPGDRPEQAVGRRVYGGFIAGPDAEVIGVVPTGRQISIGEDPTPAVFTSLEQMRTVPTATLFFRTSGSPDLLVHEVAARLRALDAAVPVHDAEPAAALVERALWAARASAGLLSTIATLGLLLAALGIYGVVASLVGERRREMGIRLALGAGHGRVYRLVVGRVAVVALAGIGIGFAVLLAAGRVAAGLLHGVPPTDPLTLTAVAGGLLIVAVLAAWLPARRATRIDPLEVLRAE